MLERFICLFKKKKEEDIEYTMSTEDLAFWNKLPGSGWYCLPRSTIKVLVDHDLGIEKKNPQYESIKKWYDNHIQDENCERCQECYEDIKLLHKIDYRF